MIVSHNSRPGLGRCLTPLVSDDQVEVIVYDSGSTDGSAEWVGQQFPSAHRVGGAENVGFARGINAAARQARGDYLLLLNPDTEPSPALPGQMVAALAESGAAAIGVRQVDGTGFFQLACGPGPSLWADLLRKIIQLRLDRRDRRVAALVERLLAVPRDVPWVAGSCLMVRREAFATVGGFDEGFFLYFEDIDFCLRLRAEGMRVRYDPRVSLVHHRGMSARTNAQRAARAYRRSQLRFWGKHRGLGVRRLVSLYLRLRGLLSTE